MPVSHDLESFADFRKGQSMGLELGQQFSVFTAVPLELRFTLLLDGLMLRHLPQAVEGLLVVYSLYRAVTVIYLSAGGVREKLFFNMSYLDKRICDFTNL